MVLQCKNGWWHRARTIATTLHFQSAMNCLRAAGRRVPPLLTEVMTPSGEHHLVLVVGLVKVNSCSTI